MILETLNAEKLIADLTEQVEQLKAPQGYRAKTGSLEHAVEHEQTARQAAEGHNRAES